MSTINHPRESANASDTLPDLYQLAKVRRQNAYVKSMNPSLVKRELLNHQLTIKEYHRDLSRHLASLERASSLQTNSMPSLSCFQSQPYINAEMRYLIFEFLMCCHSRLSLTTSTLFQTFHLVDRYTSKFILKNTNYQLVALTCLWISAKFFDVKKNIPSGKVLENLCCLQYTTKQFVATEFQILQSLNWSVSSSPTPDAFIDMILFEKTLALSADKALNVNEIKILSIMLCELCEFRPELAYRHAASARAQTATAVALMVEQFSQNGKWYKISGAHEAFLDTLFEGAEIIPASFKLKYDESKLGKLAAFITKYKAEKAMNEYIASVIDGSACTNTSTNGGAPAPTCESSPSADAFDAKTDRKISNVGRRDVIMPLTPTTPVYLKKRYHEGAESSDATTTGSAAGDAQPSPFKRACK
ncbi:hypothetical protein DAKH74_057290 [Maudiozyma humilis]|uniref:Cyclin-like domain-containing protein n=1 Tax=Maudiozyma humilis TaxID=51915 RepID=A0AAV5S8U8_MAUHU|nr:hypothetical protein DAKH74_057290 [Kazachstania humilis]